MKVLVTGGSGFIGSYIVEQLAVAGHEVVALVRKSSNRKFLSSLPNVTFAFGSVEDAAAVDSAVSSVDAVIHSAGLVKALAPRDFELVNVEGTKNLLAAAKKRNGQIKRFVHISSLAAVGPSMSGQPVKSDSPPRPVTHYGRSKLEGERAALACRNDLHITVIRPPMVYGPRDTESFAFFRTVKMGLLPVLDGGKNTLSIIYGADAASACIRALFADIPSGRAYFVEDGSIYVWRDMLAELERVIGRRALVRFSIPLPVFGVIAAASESVAKLRKKPAILTRDKVNELAAPHWVCDASDTRAELGWKPEVNWADGARRAAAWYREQGWL